MDLPDLKANLRYLVGKYIPDEVLRTEFDSLIDNPGKPPVKSIMSEVSRSDCPGDPEDESLFKDISFHYL